jgi:hypothetical protein
MVRDALHGGEPIPGLVGRVMLIGENQDMLCCEGSLIVRLYNGYKSEDGSPQLIEQWNFDKDSFKKLANRDLFGWGYTLFLPTERCHPGVTMVHFTVEFHPENSIIPLYSTQFQVRMHYNDEVGFGAIREELWDTGRRRRAPLPAFDSPIRPRAANR